MIGEHPPTLADARLDWTRDPVMSLGRVTRWANERTTLTLEIDIDAKTSMDLAETFAKNGWRGPKLAAVLGALVANLGNGAR